MNIAVKDISSKLESITDVKTFVQQLLWTICKNTEACQGAFYIKENNNLKFMEGYAFPIVENEISDLEIGEGLTGQVAKDGKFINITDVPQGYLTVFSGLGKSSPTSLLIYPFKDNDTCKAILELAGFKPFDEQTVQLLNQLNPIVIQKIN